MIDTVIITLITALLFFTLMMLYGYLLLSKWRGNTIKRRKKAWIDAHLSDIETFLITGGSPISFLPRRSHHFEALEDYFSDYLSAYKMDPDYNPLKDEYVAEAFTARYSERLFHHKWSVRMNTLYFIQLFKMENMRDKVLELLRAKYCTSEEEYLIYIILAEFHYDQLLKLFSSARRNIPPFLLNQMLSRLIRQDNIDEYVDYFDQLPYTWKLSALDVFRDKHLRSNKLQAMLEQLLSSEDIELRLRTLKTVGSLSYITSPEIISYLWDELAARKEWNSPQAAAEKIMLARLMGNIKHESFLLYLEQLISDRVYAVRSESAKAIRKYKDGKQRLRKIANNNSDGFARNIANEWLERSVVFE